MTKAASKPRKPRVKKAEPTIADVMALVVAQGLLIEDLQTRLNLSLEQTRNETGASREAGRMQERVNKGLTDSVYGDGKPGVIADTQANTNSITILQSQLADIKKPLDSIRNAAIVGVISLMVSVFLLALNLTLSAGIFAPR